MRFSCFSSELCMQVTVMYNTTFESHLWRLVTVDNFDPKKPVVYLEVPLVSVSICQSSLPEFCASSRLMASTTTCANGRSRTTK